MTLEKMKTYSTFAVMKEVDIVKDILAWIETAEAFENKKVIVTCRYARIDFDEGLTGEEADQKLHERLHAEPFEGAEVELSLAVEKTPWKIIARVYNYDIESDDCSPMFTIFMNEDNAATMLWFVMRCICNDPRTFDN